MRSIVIRKDADKKSLGSCDRSQEDVCTTKRKDLFVIQRQKRRSLELCGRPTKEGLHQTNKIPSNVVMPDSHLGNKSGIFHYNNENNQLKKQVQSSRDIH